MQLLSILQLSPPFEYAQTVYPGRAEFTIPLSLLDCTLQKSLPDTSVPAMSDMALPLTGDWTIPYNLPDFTAPKDDDVVVPAIPDTAVPEADDLVVPKVDEFGVPVGQDATIPATDDGSVER